METRNSVQVPNFEFDHSNNMANEFDKRVEDSETIWTCRVCNIDIRCRSKPRDHVCIENDIEQQNMENQTTTTTTATTTTTTSTTATPARTSTSTRQPMSAPATPFAFPPPPMGGDHLGNLGARIMFPPNPNPSEQMSAMQWQMIQQDQFQQTMLMIS